MSLIIQFICICFHVTLISRYAVGAPNEHRITSLPGWDGDLPSKHYSGYLNITTSKHYHYWFIEAENDPENAPIVLWLNGGPGCSSLYGLLEEHGPFRINDSTDPPTLYRFEYNWAKLANMIYLESPVGVGFTYSDNAEDYENTDETTMIDNLLAVELFFELFPEEAHKDLYLTGESYAGIYVPTLAEGILEKSINGTYTGAPLKGIAVGNGCTGSEIGVCLKEGNSTFVAQYFVETTAFVKPDLKRKLNDNCAWDTPYDISPACNASINEMWEDLHLINTYGVYCDKTNREAASAYLNQDEVIEAIHVQKQNSDWNVCNSTVNKDYSMNGRTRPNLPRDTYPFLSERIRILIYNGDWDAVVPYTDNFKWTKDMGFDVVEDWHQWFYNNSISQDNGISIDNHNYQRVEAGEQVGGYAIRYAHNFTFITVRGGRHEVPETAPASSFEMLRRFLRGIDF